MHPITMLQATNHAGFDAVDRLWRVLVATVALNCHREATWLCTKERLTVEAKESSARSLIIKGATSRTKVVTRHESVERPPVEREGWIFFITALVFRTNLVEEAAPLKQLCAKRAD